MFKGTQLLTFGSITCLFLLLFVKPRVKLRWQCSCYLNAFAYKSNWRSSWYIDGSFALAAARKDSRVLSVAIVTGNLSWLLRWTLPFLHKKHLSLNNFGTLEFVKEISLTNCALVFLLHFSYPLKCLSMQCSLICTRNE